MAGEVEVFEHTVLTIDGESIDVGGDPAVSTKGVAGECAEESSNVYRRRVVIPASTSKNVWLWADTSGAAMVIVRPVRPPGGEAEGFIQIGMRYNSPTSSTDLTPTGSINHWKDLSKSCVAPFMLDTERAYIHATASNAVAQSGSGTYPGVWGEGAKVLGVLDAIAFRNEDSEDEAVFDLIVIPK